MALEPFVFASFESTTSVRTTYPPAIPEMTISLNISKLFLLFTM